jgi:hypothetical protein
MIIMTRKKMQTYTEEFYREAINRTEKEGGCVLCEKPRVKYVLIREHTSEFPVVLMCRVLLS